MARPAFDSGRLYCWWQQHGWWIGPAALALAVRVAYTLVAEDVDPFLRSSPLHGDAASYDLIARSLLAGDGFATTPRTPTAFWPPLYPFLLAGIYSVIGHYLLAARLVQALLGVLAVVATSFVARDLYGRQVAVLAGLGMALYPHLIYFGAWLIAEAMYLAMLTLALLTAVRLQRRPRLAALGLLGALLGLSSLAKPYTVTLLPLMAVWAVVALPGQPLAKRAAGLGLLLAAVIAVVAPWAARNGRVFGAFVPVSTNGGYTFYGANNAAAFGGHREGFPPPIPGLSEPQAEREYYRLGLAWIRSDPGGFVWLAGHKLTRLLSPLSVASYEHDYPLPLAGLVKAVYGTFLALALAGMLRSVRRSREVLILYALPIAALVNAVLFYGDTRYTLPAVPALVVFAASATIAMLDAFRARLPGAAGRL